MLAGPLRTFYLIGISASRWEIHQKARAKNSQILQIHSNRASFLRARIRSEHHTRFGEQSFNCIRLGKGVYPCGCLE